MLAVSVSMLYIASTIFIITCDYGIIKHRTDSINLGLYDLLKHALYFLFYKNMYEYTYTNLRKILPFEVWKTKFL